MVVWVEDYGNDRFGVVRPRMGEDSRRETC